MPEGETMNYEQVLFVSNVDKQPAPTLDELGISKAEFLNMRVRELNALYHSWAKNPSPEGFARFEEALFEE